MGGATAYGDESVRTDCDTPMYLMCATIAPDDASLAELVALKPKAASKLHWREMGRSLQRRSLDAIAGIGCTSIVVVSSPLDRGRPERSRRKCLEALAQALEAKGVRRLVLKGRSPAQDAMDRECMMWLAQRGASRIRVSHAAGASDPRLWVPDQVVGAFGDVLCEERVDARWAESWQAVDKLVEMHMARP